MIKSLIYLMIAVLLSMTIAACGKSKQNLIDLVPEGNMLGNVQVSKLIDVEAIKDAYEQMDKTSDMPPTFEGALDYVEEEFGIDLRELSQGLFFGSIGSDDSEVDFGCIVEGSFDESRFIDGLEKYGDTVLDVSEYRDHTIYLDDDGGLGLCFIEDEIMVVGSPQATRDVIDVVEGEKPPISGRIRDNYDALGDADLKTIIAIPGEAWTEVIDEDSLGDNTPFSLDFLKEMEYVGFSLNTDDENLDLSLKLYWSDATVAQESEELIRSFLNIFKLMSEDPELQGLLDSIDISSSGLLVSIDIELNADMLEALMEMSEMEMPLL
ncbi:hypothetical protein ACFLX5_05215 [Chloroflexota bacterium]